MRSESDQHRSGQVRSLLRTTPFEKCLITVIMEGKLSLVFLVPAVLYFLCLLMLSLTAIDPPSPLSLLAIGFHGVPFGRMSAGC